jgi:ketosteroid isomerase-like protein
VTNTSASTALATATDTEILAVLDEHAAAHAARDVQRMIAAYTYDAVCYTLAPPLQQGPDTAYGTPEGLQAWLATFDGPVLIDYRDPVVTADGDVAFVHTLTQMTATPPAPPTRSLSGSAPPSACAASTAPGASPTGTSRPPSTWTAPSGPPSTSSRDHPARCMPTGCPATGAR